MCRCGWAGESCMQPDFGDSFPGELKLSPHRRPLAILMIDSLWEAKEWAYDSNFQPFSSHGTHKLITKILRHTKNTFFADPTEKYRKYNFDSFTPDGYYCVGCCHFLLTIWGKRRQCPWLNSQILHALKILAAHWLKIAGRGDKICSFFFFNFYCYSITVVCLFSPSLHPTPAEPTSLPHLHPPTRYVLFFFLFFFFNFSLWYNFRLSKNHVKFSYIPSIQLLQKLIYFTLYNNKNQV